MRKQKLHRCKALPLSVCSLSFFSTSCLYLYTLSKLFIGRIRHFHPQQE